MPSLRSIMLVSIALASSILAQSHPEPSSKKAEQKHDKHLSFNFQELLNALPEESIHAALHKHLDGKYQDGTYEHDRVAVEAVRNEDPPTATILLAEAALDLIKRQNGNGTVVASTTTSTSVSVVATTTATTSSPAAVVVPVEVSTTNSAGSTIVSTTSAVATASVSVTVAVTTTDSKGSTVVSSSTVAAAIVTSNGVTSTSTVPTFNAATVSTSSVPKTISTTDSAGNSVVLTNVHTGATLTATNAKGSTFITTYTPGGGAVQSLVFQTTTLPNGQPTTITSFAAVEAQTAPASSAGSTTTSGPKLQNGAESVKSRSFGAEAVALVGGAIGVALFL